MKNIHEKKRNAGIFSRVLKGYALIVVIVLFFACLVSVRLVRGYVIGVQKDELLEKAQFILPARGSKPDWSLIRKYQTIADAEIIFIDKNYVAASIPRKNVVPSDTETVQPSYVEIVSGMDIEIIDKIRNGEGVTGIEDVKFLTQDVLYAGVPVFNANKEYIGALMLFRPVENIDDIWMSVIYIFCIFCICGVLLITAFSWLFSKGLTTPLRQMNCIANKMGEGDYSKRIKIARNDEIGTLGETLNLLSSRLEKLIESLQNEKSRLEMVLMNIGEGIVACDEECNLLHLNTAALGYLEICCWEKQENEGKMRVIDLMRICIKSGEIVTNNWKSGTKRDISLVATPIRNADKMIIGAVCLLRDVSSEMHLERRRREYIGNVSHELRTPLTGIRGMIEPLVDGICETEEEKQANYQVILKETLRLEKLIRDMLELSRLQEGKEEALMERFELTDAVRNGLEGMRPLAEKAGIKLNTRFQEEIFVKGDSDRVSELIVILTDNAISFTPEGGEIEISVRKDGAKALVSVKDTGAGIEPMDLPYIWERFYKADKSRLRTGGTGLGLAIAKHIVEMMNGSIEVESEPEKGSTFTFRLNID